MLKLLGKWYLNCLAWFIAKFYSCIDRVDDYMEKKVDEFLEDK